MQFDEKFLKQYKEIIIAALIIILMAAFGIKNIVGAVTKMQTTRLEHKKQKEKLKAVKKNVEEYEKTKQKMQAQQSKMKPVFDPKSSAEDSIAAFGGMFEDIIDYVKMNGLKLRSVEYKINPAEDPIYANFPTLYSVCQINLFIVGFYSQLEGLLRDLTMYPYFINISKVQIEPYEKDKQYLLVNLSITLYAKKQQGTGSLLN